MFGADGQAQHHSGAIRAAPSSGIGFLRSQLLAWALNTIGTISQAILIASSCTFLSYASDRGQNQYNQDSSISAFKSKNPYRTCHRPRYVREPFHKLCKHTSGKASFHSGDMASIIVSRVDFPSNKKDLPACGGRLL